MSIAPPSRRTGPTEARDEADDAPFSLELATVVLVVLAMFALYAQSNPLRNSPYDHFVRQADAFLAGRIRWHQIADTNAEALARYEPDAGLTVDAIVAADQRARAVAREVLPA